MDDFYSRNAQQLIQKYESVPSENIHGKWTEHIQKKCARILDVGSGSGRDAAWLAEKGHEVVGVEPSDRLRKMAEHIHPHPSIRWIKDSLPELKNLKKQRFKFDLILLSAVWIHVLPENRKKALQNLKSLLNPDSCLVMTLRHGPSPDERIMHQCSFEELHDLVHLSGFKSISCIKSSDGFSRPEVSWQTIVIKSPS